MGSLLDDDCDGVRCCKAGGGWPAGGCNEKVVPSGDICLSTSHGVALATFGSEWLLLGWVQSCVSPLLLRL